MSFQNFFSNSKVLVTGHTGFKGSWLSSWLIALGADVIGVSLDIPTQPSHFVAIDLKKRLHHHLLDIRDFDSIKDLIVENQPDYVFHLAAQPLVNLAYQKPLQTYHSNILGTAHILEGLRTLQKPCIAIIITSDKCYQNVEWTWGYRENDSLGGEDPYSASKGAAELVIRSYFHSYFAHQDSPIKLGVGRAGNVIGGGDWAMGRIVPDCVRAWQKNHTVELRNPSATRPWQHVLEPISGYLTLASLLKTRPELNGEAFNFGPASTQNYSVLDLVQEMQKHWQKVSWQEVSRHVKYYESTLLKLNCDKAFHSLKWLALLDFSQTVKMTTEWYKNYYSAFEPTWLFTQKQIQEYSQIAAQKKLQWTQ